MLPASTTISAFGRTLIDDAAASNARTTLGLGTAATTASTAYATAAQGTLAANALPKAGGAMTGAITTNSTFDGRDVATDGTKLDSIETGATADQTAAQIQLPLKLLMVLALVWMLICWMVNRLLLLPQLKAHLQPPLYPKLAVQ